LQGQKRAKKSYDLRWQSVSIPAARFKPKSRKEFNRVPKIDVQRLPSAEYKKKIQ
jgi:hypothetical protein